MNRKRKRFSLRRSFEFYYWSVSPIRSFSVSFIYRTGCDARKQIFPSFFLFLLPFNDLLLNYFIHHCSHGVHGSNATVQAKSIADTVITVAWMDRNRNEQKTRITKRQLKNEIILRAFREKKMKNILTISIVNIVKSRRHLFRPSDRGNRPSLRLVLCALRQWTY